MRLIWLLLLVPYAGLLPPLVWVPLYNRRTPEQAHAGLAFPADGSGVQINGTPAPFQITEIIWTLIVVLPTSQLV